MKVEVADVLGVGAGIAGLVSAGTLARAGARVILLERSAGVGGRCATRRVNGQPIDHGLVFLHGVDPRFLSALRSVDGSAAQPWPTRLSGTGIACHPAAFREGTCCVAYADGLTVFPKHLARGLDVRLRSSVRLVEPAEDGWRAVVEDGSVFVAKQLFLTLPVESAVALLSATPAAGETLARVRGLLSLVGTVPCLAAIAGYRSNAPEPPWHVSYPEESTLLQLTSNDSSKRRSPDSRVLVFQARPAWSSRRLESEPASWGAAMLEEGARLYGDWVRRPEWLQTHVWRHARVAPSETVAEPIVLPSGRAGSLGLAGEAFDAAAGAEGAFLSGLALGRALAVEA
jgi:predicted NAD/FAD-dependent oxidoreductase